MIHDRQNRILSSAFRLLIKTAACILLTASISYAYQEPPLPVDPTPLAKLIPATELASIESARNKPKKLVEVYLKIAETHLDSAHKAIKASDYQTAERELDIYNKALGETADFAFSQQKDKRTLAKKIEQELYKQIKTLEIVERLFPAERIRFAETAHIQAKQLRVRALNEAFASGDVLQDPTEEKKEAKNPPLPELKKNLLAPGHDFSLVGSSSKVTQIPGDYLTEEEDDHVRKNQAPDDRVKVFMKIADRRLSALAPPAIDANDKKAKERAEKEELEWGPIPKVSRADLLKHYSRAIEEAMAKLEDAYERNPKSQSLMKALAILRDTTDKHLIQLRSLTSELKDENEIAALRMATSQAETANEGAKETLKGKQ